MATGYSSDSSLSSLAPNHKCHFCEKVFKVEGRYLKHMEKVHPDQLAARRAGEPDFRPTFPVPEGRPTADTLDYIKLDGTDGDEEFPRFRRVLRLLRPLTALVTRITTTLQTQEADYDSEDDLSRFDTDAGIPTPREPDEKAPVDTEEGSTGRVEMYPGEPIIVREKEEKFPTRESLWHPFRSGYEFKLARWIMDSNLSKVQINSFFNRGLARIPPVNPNGSEGTCFTSAHVLGNILDNLDNDLTSSSWTKAAVDHPGAGLIEFRYRSLETIIRHIFEQVSHSDYMVYMPYKEFDPETGYRMYSEMASAEWWWERQVCSIR